MWAGGAYGYLLDYLVLCGLVVSLLVHTWCFFKLFPREKHHKTGLVLGNMLVMLAMLGVVALAMETHIRFTMVATDSFGVSLPARRWFALNTKLNSLGCRDKEWSAEKPPGVTRIAFVGDSFTYGWGIKRTADRFPDLIQARFDARAPGTVEILNVAKPGWNTGDELQPTTDMIERYGVDEVVLCYVPNDIEGLIPTTDDFNPTRPPEPVLFNPDSFCLLDYLYRRVYLPRLPTVRGFDDWLAEGYADETIWRAHQKQLFAIKRVCDQHDVRLRVALLPFIKTGGEKLHLDKLFALLERLLDVNGFEYADLLPSITGVPSGDLVVNASDAHPNEEANRRFAEALWQAFYASRKPK